MRGFDPMQWTELGLGEMATGQGDFEHIFFGHLQDKTGPELGYITKITTALQVNIARKRTFWMADGSIGLGPINMKPDDIVCVLGCSSFPVVFRKVSAHYLFVGFYYVYGLIDGEMALMAEQDGREAVRFDIR
jgi:hypothetical protein